MQIWKRRGGSVPDGKTVTPINDVTIWQQCAGLAVAYDTLSEILSDSGYVRALMASDNAVDYMIRSTDFAAFQSLVPAMTSNTTPEGECFANNEYSSNYQAWEAFDGIDEAEDRWATSSYTPAYIGYRFTNPKCVKKFKLKCVCPSSVTYTYQLQGSNDGSTYYNIGGTVTTTHSSSAIYVEAEKEVSNNNDYIYYRVYITSNVSNNVSLCTLEFYSASIVDSETAMQYIGASDYASNQVLTNTTWREAICKSDYVESVLNVSVPTMTSNTTPEGECFGSGTYGSGTYQFYYLFDGNSSTQWQSNSITNPYVGYTFTKQVTIYKAYMYGMYNTPGTYKIQGSNDKSTWVDLTSNRSDASPANITLDNPGTYTSYRVFFVSRTYSDRSIFIALNFYGRQIGGIQTWLTAANIQKNYYTLAQVLADTNTLNVLMNSTAAVDYLVTVKGWISIITNNEAAMTAIGNSNYAANTLLADSDWRNAIINSAYIDSVMNISVPAMVSNTNPEGEVSADSIYGGIYDAYKAFDKDASTFWIPTLAKSDNYLIYHFTKAVNIYAALATRTYTGSPAAINSYIEGSNDGTNWTAISSNVTMSTTGGSPAIFKYICDDSTAYEYIRWKTPNSFVPANNNNYQFNTLQFYGRQDV